MKPFVRCAFAALLAVAAIVPILSRAQKPGPPHRAPSLAASAVEPAAMALLKRSQDATLALRGYTAECRTVLTRDKAAKGGAMRRFMLSKLTAAKPNKMRYDAWESGADLAARGWRRPAGAPTYTMVSNGTKGWKQFGLAYRKDNRVRPEELSTILEPWTGFYSGGDSAYGLAQVARKNGDLKEVKRAGRATVEGVSCDKVDVVIVSSANGEPFESRATWFIGPDGLVRRCVAHVSFNNQPGVSRDSTIVGIKKNGSADARVFAYTPPPGVKLQEVKLMSGALPNGTRAPEFTARDTRKRTVKLSDFRGTVVIVDFWASWCGPCKQSMPHNQDVVRKLRAQKLPVVLLALDDGEPRDAFDTWIAKNARSMPELTFVHSPPESGVSAELFRVTSIPTQYVIDRKGIVRASFVGYAGPTDDLEDAVRAALRAH
jgi:thiol-disulfide isomerase/thioredoxin